MYLVFDLKKELLELVRLLNADGIEYAFCGGIAVAIHGYPRSTRDIDILVREESLENILALVGKAGFTFSAGIIPFDVGKKTERRIFRISKVEGEDILTMDLILVVPFLKDVWSSRERYQLGNQEIQVVSLEGLRKMKKAAGRPRDLVDLQELGLGVEE